MPVTQLLSDFEAMKAARRRDANFSIGQVGRFAKDAHRVLLDHAEAHEIEWTGSGDKTYVVYSRAGEVRPWSRGVNADLYITDPAEFARTWDAFEAACTYAASQGALPGFTPDEVNRVVYTAVMSWAVAVDLFNPSNGLGGTYFEMLVGPVISRLTGRPETGDVRIELGEGLGHETVKVDLTFHDAIGKSSLAVPTKISTRERISQAYVHAAILESAFPGRYNTILGIVNENNAFHRKGVPAARRSVHSLYLSDTLVPGTIGLYQKYIAPLDGLYYLDPPHRYVDAPRDGFPKVASLGDLLTKDLPGLL